MRPPSEVTRTFFGEFDAGGRTRLGMRVGKPVLPGSLKCEEETQSPPGDPEDPWPARRIALRREYGGHEHERQALRREAPHPEALGGTPIAISSTETCRPRS